jgi:hypothetical protein
VMRAAAYGGGGALLVAWFAAAAGSPGQDVAPARDSMSQSAPTSGSASVAAEVQAQAVRLRERLAQAPAPDFHSRNPFTFAPLRLARAPSPPTMGTSPETEPVPSVVAPPVLVLMGIAEDTSAEGLRRTAVIGGADNALYMVIEGETFADRYSVTTIGQDAVELKDLVTGAYRRLAMR